MRRHGIDQGDDAGNLTSVVRAEGRQVGASDPRKRSIDVLNYFTRQNVEHAPARTDQCDAGFASCVISCSRPPVFDSTTSACVRASASVAGSQ
jgi:hypothetical protein